MKPTTKAEQTESSKNDAETWNTYISSLMGRNGNATHSFSFNGEK